jgi:hypothetical protein
MFKNLQNSIKATRFELTTSSSKQWNLSINLTKNTARIDQNAHNIIEFSRWIEHQTRIFKLYELFNTLMLSLKRY